MLYLRTNDSGHDLPVASSQAVDQTVQLSDANFSQNFYTLAQLVTAAHTLMGIDIKVSNFEYSKFLRYDGDDCYWFCSDSGSVQSVIRARKKRW